MLIKTWLLSCAPILATATGIQEQAEAEKLRWQKANALLEALPNEIFWSDETISFLQSAFVAERC